MRNVAWYTLFFLLTGCLKPTTAYVVRHAEKDMAANPSDPPLSEAGLARAEALDDLLYGRSITAIFVTDTARSRATAAPLAEHAGRVPIVYSDAADAALQVLGAYRGSSVLVVGHSNTVGPIIEALGATVPSTLVIPIPDDDFGNIVTVEIPAKGEPIATHETYGEGGM